MQHATLASKYTASGTGYGKQLSRSQEISSHFGIVCHKQAVGNLLNCERFIIVGQERMRTHRQ